MKKYPILLGPPNVLNSSINSGISLWTLVGEDGLRLSNFLKISYVDPYFSFIQFPSSPLGVVRFPFLSRIFCAYVLVGVGV